MKEFYTLQPDDYANVSQTNFQLALPDGTLVKLDTTSSSPGCKALGTLRTKTGNPVTWKAFRNPDIFKSTEPWASITDTNTNQSLRHCNGVVWESVYEAGNQDFAWIFYKQADGSYYLLNPFNYGCYLGYDATMDALRNVPVPFNWKLMPVAPPAPVVPVAAAPAPAPAAPAPAPQIPMSYLIGGGILMCFCLLILVLLLRK